MAKPKDPAKALLATLYPPAAKTKAPAPARAPADPARALLASLYPEGLPSPKPADKTPPGGALPWFMVRMPDGGIPLVHRFASEEALLSSLQAVLSAGAAEFVVAGHGALMPFSRPPRDVVRGPGGLRDLVTGRPVPAAEADPDPGSWSGVWYTGPAYDNPFVPDNPLL